ncbi:unnamed protein product [Caenorhabditis bovis]|uniref:peroxidase n=1 Tax=Caenorhabditis bovis TaxID=2654633 RepID=A0A8S1EXS2_9PELO|nr:unnamed protein product [Caenorhabditis bovis]
MRLRIFASSILLLVTTIVDCQQCRDSNLNCEFWSRRGECAINPKWMLRNCQKSCGTCSPPPPPVLPSTRTTQTSPTTRMMGFQRDEIVARTSSNPDGCNSVMAIEAETRQIFSIGQVRGRTQRMMCAEQQIPPDCSVNQCFLKKFRSIDGTCNNLARPAEGAALTAFARLLPPAYDDGFNTLVGSSKRNRPNPREVSMFLLTSSKAIPGHANSMLMQFGQFVSHDITANSAAAICGCQSAGPLCAAIPAPPSDRFRRCIAFTRSFPICGTGQFGRVREQLNENTAFIDGSGIYGSEGITARSLRFNAMLRSSVINGKVFPPMAQNNLNVGDSRSNLFVGLAALHTTFLRLHNNIAARLQNMNGHWNGDRIFQEARKIVGGVIQVITYQEFLPLLIGSAAQTQLGAYNGYNPSINPGILNEFAASAYRLHGMIQESYPILNHNYQRMGSLNFIENMMRLEGMLNGLDSIYRGLMATPSRSPQRLTVSMTERMFGGALDMAAMNIQRGRDHGLRPYNDYRRACNLPTVADFNSWREVPDAAVRQRVAQLYRSPQDVDLYVGGILEAPEAGSFVGPTFACIIAKQFKNLRDGDRYYFENPGVFTSAQLNTLRRTTLAWVLCQTGDNMSKIGRNAFEIENGSRAVPCSSITSLDMSAWRE